jgi:hypothetical protein
VDFVCVGAISIASHRASDSEFRIAGLDHFVVDRLRISPYLRYVDDFALFSDDKAQLTDARVAIEAHLANLRVRIHPIKSQLYETRIGANFVGFRIFPDRIRVRNDNLRRSRQRLKQMQADRAAGTLDETKGVRSFTSWMLRGRATTTTVFESSLSFLCLRALFTCQNRRMEIRLACTEESSPAPAIVLPRSKNQTRVG